MLTANYAVIDNSSTRLISDGLTYRWDHTYRGIKSPANLRRRGQYQLSEVLKGIGLSGTFGVRVTIPYFPHGGKALHSPACPAARALINPDCRNTSFSVAITATPAFYPTRIFTATCIG